MNLKELIELIAEQAAREVVVTTPEHLSAALVKVLGVVCDLIKALRPFHELLSNLVFEGLKVGLLSHNNKSTRYAANLQTLKHQIQS